MKESCILVQDMSGISLDVIDNLLELTGKSLGGLRWFSGLPDPINDPTSPRKNPTEVYRKDTHCHEGLSAEFISG